MDTLYEDLFSDVKGMVNNKKRQMGIDTAEYKSGKHDDSTITSDSNYNNGKTNLDDEFCKRLIGYLEKEMDKSFPGHTKLKSVLKHEIRKVMKNGDENDIKKVVEKIRDIILKEKVKFIDNIEKKVSKILISK